jgi:2,4-dienoyl-CoA reductase-like NADH-dependent reductase (Old Yellow Enzyme family)
VPIHPVLTPTTIGALSLPNRAVVAPMSRVPEAINNAPLARRVYDGAHMTAARWLRALADRTVQATLTAAPN